MGIKTSFKSFLKGFLEEEITSADAVIGKKEIANLAYKELAISTCINLIANAISQCTARTYENNTEVFGQSHYILNVRPNINESSTMLWHKAVEKMVNNGEAIIVNISGNLYVADSYIVNEYPIKGHIYESVVIGNLQLNKKFRQDEVIVLRLNNVNIKRLIDGLYNSYEEMLNLCTEKYKQDNQQKYVLELDNVKVGDKMFNDKYREAMQEQLGDFLNNQNAVLPLFKGQTLTDVSKTSSASSNDFQSLIENLFRTVAQAFNIPVDLLFGKTDNIDKVTKQFLTFTIEPIASMISEELSAKLYDGFIGFQKGDYVRIDTSDIQHISILEMATAIDKLISSGAFTINEVRALTGYNKVNEEYGDVHFITKNYSTMDAMLNPVDDEPTKGGE